MICSSRKRTESFFFFPKVLGNSAVTMEVGGGGGRMLNGDRADWLGTISQTDHAEFMHWSVGKDSSQRFSDFVNNTNNAYCRTSNILLKLKGKKSTKHKSWPLTRWLNNYWKHSWKILTLFCSLLLPLSKVLCLLTLWVTENSLCEFFMC